MANGEDEIRPRTITAANVWEAFDRLRDENREARHSQNNYIAGVIAAESKETRGIMEGLEGRLRVVENSIATNTPTSLGQRLGDMEKWQAVISSTTLPSRVDAIESTLDQMRGSLNFLKWAQTIVGLAVAALTLIGIVLVNRPA